MIKYESLSDEDKAHVLRARLAEYERDHFLQTAFLNAGRAAADPHDVANRGQAVTVLDGHLDRIRKQLKAVKGDTSPTLTDEHRRAIVDAHIARLERDHLLASMRVEEDDAERRTGAVDSAMLTQHEARLTRVTTIEARMEALRDLRASLGA